MRLNLLGALVTGLGITGADAPGADLEGTIQYPPPSIGEDAQPPPPARMLPQPVSPWRIELGVSGSSVPPSKQRYYIRSPLRWNGPGAPPQSGNGD
jgi:hypothetical protein